jgi:leucyl aminopeptidase
VHTKIPRTYGLSYPLRKCSIPDLIGEESLPPDSGADDDGSGTTSSITGLRALAHANFTPSNPVEFHYYSAEEGGLLGSQAIAKSYEDAGKKVLAMLQMDMTAWVKAGTEERVGIIEDFVDPALTEFMEGLVAEYCELELIKRGLLLISVITVDIPSVRTKCGYACSDHASFLKAGYQSSFA